MRKTEPGTDGDRRRQHDQPAGQPRQVPLQREQQDQGHQPDREGGQAGAPEVAQQVAELADRVAGTLLQPEQLGQLAHRHEDGQPEHETRHDRPRQEGGDKPQPQQPGDDEDQPGQDDHPRGQRGVAGRVLRLQRRHGGED
jgi:hypothetical protein